MLEFPENTTLTEAQIDRILTIEERYLAIREKELEVSQGKTDKELELREKHLDNQAARIKDRKSVV